jgi:hypothetical protein
VLTRLFVFALFVGTVGCARQISNPETVDAEMASYLPSDATLIGGVRLKILRTRPIFKHVSGALPEASRPFAAQADEILFASDGKQTLVLARGKFDRQQLEREANGVQLVFLKPDLVAAGSPASLAAAQKRTGSALTKDTPVGADLWVVTNGNLPLDLPERSNFSNLNRMRRDLQLATLSLNAGDGVHLAAHASFGTPAGAEQMHTTLRGLMGFARLSLPHDKPELQKAFDSVQVTLKERSVDFAAAWSEEQAEKILDMAH